MIKIEIKIERNSDDAKPPTTTPGENQQLEIFTILRITIIPPREFIPRIPIAQQLISRAPITFARKSTIGDLLEPHQLQKKSRADRPKLSGRFAAQTPELFRKKKVHTLSSRIVLLMVTISNTILELKVWTSAAGKNADGCRAT